MPSALVRNRKRRSPHPEGPPVTVCDAGTKGAIRAGVQAHGRLFRPCLWFLV